MKILTSRPELFLEFETIYSLQLIESTDKKVEEACVSLFYFILENSGSDKPLIDYIRKIKKSTKCIYIENIDSWLVKVLGIGVFKEKILDILERINKEIPVKVIGHEDLKDELKGIYNFISLSKEIKENFMVKINLEDLIDKKFSNKLLKLKNKNIILDVRNFENNVLAVKKLKKMLK